MNDNGRLTFKQQLRLTGFAVGLFSLILLIVGVSNIARQRAAQRGAEIVATRSAEEAVSFVTATPASLQKTAVSTSSPTIAPTDNGTAPTRSPTTQIDNGRPLGSEDISESQVPTVRPGSAYATPTSPPMQEMSHLINQLAIEPIQLNNGYQTSRVNSGRYGYRNEHYCDGPYRWLDNEHLMLNLVLGYTNWFESPTGGELTQPIILDLNEDAPWVMDTPLTDICELPVWSESRQQLIEASDGNVRVRELSGQVVETYLGSYPLHIAPSGQRILANMNWIDLETGELVELDGRRVNFPNPAWTADERRFFDCCLAYGDVDSNDYWQQAGLPGMFITGIGVGPGYTGSKSHWVADETAVMIPPSAINFWRNDNQPVIPILNPVTQTVEDAFVQLNLPEEAIDCYPQIAPTGDYFWLGCAKLIDQEYQAHSETAYLVALPSWEVTTISGFAAARGWSPNGRFLIYALFDESEGANGTTWLMDVMAGTHVQIADFVATAVNWTSDSQTAALYDISGKIIQFISDGGATQWSTEVTQPLHQLHWQPNSNGLLISMGNARLHWMPDVKTDEIQTLAPHSMWAESVKWSPNGSQISFIHEQDLYIIDLTQPIEPETESNGRSNTPAISQDGNFIAFTSTGNLTGNAAGGEMSAFVRDVAAGTTELVNITLADSAGFDNIYDVAMSSNGRFIAYYSFDDTIAINGFEGCRSNCGTDLEDLYIFDRETHITKRIPRGRGQGLGADYTLALSPDGRFIVYGEDGQLIIHDLINNISSPTLTTTNNQSPNNTFAPQFAETGDIVFISYASNLVANDNNEVADVFVRNHATGAVERVSVASDGAEANDISGAMPFHEGVGNGLSISGNGRFITFISLATNLTDDEIIECDDYRGFTRSCYNIFLHDRETGETRLVSSIWGAGNGDSTQPALSDDGRYLVFTSTATNFFASGEMLSCGPYCHQIYLLDLHVGTLSLISHARDGAPGNGSSWMGAISGNGRYITFTSEASNLIQDDRNSASDIFRFDIETKKTERVSLNNAP